ncbi:MAG: hypothetical protein KFH98_02550, partial [Gemmatimonadetes bacterium]|nr:hypothetical protein [Gemmatimonadota bacterium]
MTERVRARGKVDAPDPESPTAHAPSTRMLMDRYRVKPDTRVLLAERDPDERLTFDGGRKVGREYLRELTTQLRDLQELLYAEGKHRIL